MGLSRDTFYRYQNAVAEGGVEALYDGNRRKPNPKNRVEEATEAAVLAYATEQPAHGQVRTSNELRQRGIFVSPSGVRSIWLRNDLASFKQRLSALEKKVAEQGILLNAAKNGGITRPSIYKNPTPECDMPIILIAVPFISEFVTISSMVDWVISPRSRIPCKTVWAFASGGVPIKCS
jgi:hypothetical protein